MTIGDKLKALREAKGITRAALAQAVGISVASLSEYERGKACPGLILARRLAQTLGVSLGDFDECDLPRDDRIAVK